MAVVNQTMARQLWPDAPVIGQRLRVPEYVKSASQFTLAAPGSDGWFEIVGVVGDTPNVGLHEATAPSIYVPHTLMLSDSLNVIVRTTRDPLTMTRSIREAVRAVDPQQPVNSVRSGRGAAGGGWVGARAICHVAAARIRGVRVGARRGRALQRRVVLPCRAVTRSSAFAWRSAPARAQHRQRRAGSASVVDWRRPDRRSGPQRGVECRRRAVVDRQRERSRACSSPSAWCCWSSRSRRRRFRRAAPPQLSRRARCGRTEPDDPRRNRSYGMGQPVTGDLP